MSANRAIPWLVAVTSLVVLDPAAAQVRPVQDTFTATTAGMTPTGLALRLQVLEWTDDAARAEVVTALQNTDAPALRQLPTVGYLWPAGSPVGYSIKYAQRTTTAAGGERITFVTDRPVGSYDYKPWSVAAATAKPAVDYSVIELYLDAGGNGTGNLSLAADVVIDAATNTVSLAEGAATVLAQVQRQPAA